MGYLRDLGLGLLAAEIYVHAAGPLARWIVEHAIARLPIEERERRREEWLADLDDMPGAIEKLFWALGCHWAATVTDVWVWRIAHPRVAQAGHVQRNLQAAVYIYKCQGHTVKLDDVAGTISWNGHVFSNGRMVEGCRYSYQATDQAGTVAKLCTATKGYATLDIKPVEGKALHFECNMQR